MSEQKAFNFARAHDLHLKAFGKKTLSSSHVFSNWLDTKYYINNIITRINKLSNETAKHKHFTCVTLYDLIHLLAAAII